MSSDLNFSVPLDTGEPFFGGIQKNSLIDYPGKVSCVLFLTGCNFACPYCHNPNLARGTPPRADRIPFETVYTFLESRRGLLEGVVLSGGEPTLHNAIGEICSRIKQLGYPIKLDTNGSRPEVLSRLISTGCVDYVAMDVKAPLSRYNPVITARDVSTQIKASIRLIMSSGLAYEFRTTCMQPLAGPDTIVDIANSIQGARKYVLQMFNPSRVLNPDFFKRHRVQPDMLDLEKMHKKVAPLVTECLLR